MHNIEKSFTVFKVELMSTSQSKQNTFDLVYKALKKSILTMNLLPGTAISENEISKKYEVSRTPVREAFIQLAKESLLQIIPQKETRVSLIDLARVEQEYFLRKHLESSVLEYFSKNVDNITLMKMEQFIELQRKTLEEKDYVQFIQYDDLFHKTIFEASGQNLSWEILENNSGHYYRIRLLSTWQKGIASDIVEQHSKLLNELKNHDIVQSQKSLSEHLLKLDLEKDQLMSEFPQYFKTETKSNFDVDFGGHRFK